VSLASAKGIPGGLLRSLGVTDETTERVRRASAARRLYFAQLAHRSAKARRVRKGRLGE
jgi:hypothetical protein